MHKLIKNILKVLAKLTLIRYQPKIVAITGSVGKTSTKEAVASVLSSKFSVRASFGNYNNEIGVPLTIINEQSGNKNPILWLIIFIKALFKLISTEYPEVLVLEMGADRPGDIAYLVDLVNRVDVGVLTDIGISHLLFFGSAQSIEKEKLSLIKKLAPNATAILNFDNTKIVDGKDSTKAQIVGFGFNPQANILISDFQIIDSEGQFGANFKIHHRGNVVPFFLPNALGKPAALSAAAAAAVGLHFGVNLVDASEALKKFNPPPGRLRLIEGIKHTRIIDDTYNSAPDSAVAALEALSSIAPGRKLAVMGQMSELGNKTEEAHRQLANKIIEHQVAIVFLVGAYTLITVEELDKRKFSGKVQWYETSDEARIPVQNALIEGDTILVKGSQSARCERVVKEIMADPEHADQLLVRQSGKWMNR